MEMDHVVRTVDRGGACGLHVVPHGDGAFYCGASSGVWMDPEPAPRLHALHVLIRGLAEEINGAFFYGMLNVRGPGFRPTSVDCFPLLGCSHLDGVWFANGMKRDGFTCSAFIAPRLAAEILGAPSSLPARFKPSRPLISYKNKAAALADTVTAQYGGEAQHGLVLPPYAHARYKSDMHTLWAKIYEKRGIESFGIHPEVIHFYDNDEYFAAIAHERAAPEAPLA
jgi:glycine oxidase